MKKKLLIMRVACLVGSVAGFYGCAEPPPPQIIENQTDTGLNRTRQKRPAVPVDWDAVYIILLNGDVWVQSDGGGGAYLIDAVSVTADVDDDTTTITGSEYSWVFDNIVPIYTSGSGSTSGTTVTGTTVSNGTPPALPSFATALTVQATQSNACVPGSIAAALQVQRGLSDVAATNMAIDALIARHIVPYPPVVPGPGGISIQIVDIGWVMQDLGFTVIGSQNPPVNTIGPAFNDGAWAIGIIPPNADNGYIGHMVFITGYNQSSRTYTYYDSTMPPAYRWGSIHKDEITEIVIKSNRKPL